MDKDVAIKVALEVIEICAEELGEMSKEVVNTSTFSADTPLALLVLKRAGERLRNMKQKLAEHYQGINQ